MLFRVGAEMFSALLRRYAKKNNSNIYSFCQALGNGFRQNLLDTHAVVVVVILIRIMKVVVVVVKRDCDRDSQARVAVLVLFMEMSMLNSIWTKYLAQQVLFTKLTSMGHPVRNCKILKKI